MEEPVEYNAGKKEEKRILIQTIRPYCKFREMHETTAGGESWVDFMCGKSTIKNLECDEKCFEQCEWKELIGLTRSESIKKIAEAIIREDGEGISYLYAHGLAEAALDALLSDK